MSAGLPPHASRRRLTATAGAVTFTLALLAAVRWVHPTAAVDDAVHSVRLDVPKTGHIERCYGGRAMHWPSAWTVRKASLESGSTNPESFVEYTCSGAQQPRPVSLA